MTETREIVKVPLDWQPATAEDHWRRGIAGIESVQAALDEILFYLKFVGCTPGHVADAMDSLDDVSEELDQAYRKFEQVYAAFEDEADRSASGEPA